MNIALIPAKGHSRRIPGKNMMDFCGKPLFMWSVDQAVESKSVDRVVVSTDDSDIMNCIAHSGYSSLIEVIDRPYPLCTDTTTQEEVIAHAIEVLKLKDDDNIVLLQPTSPLRLPGDIDRCIELLANGESSMAAIEEPDIFLWADNSPNTFNTLDRKLADAYNRETGSIYAVKVKAFLIWKSRYGGYRPQYLYQHKWQQFEIDDPEDIPIVEFMMKKYILKEAI